MWWTIVSDPAFKEADVVISHGFHAPIVAFFSCSAAMKAGPLTSNAVAVAGRWATNGASVLSEISSGIIKAT